MNERERSKVYDDWYEAARPDQRNNAWVAFNAGWQAALAQRGEPADLRAELEDQTKWASEYARRASVLFDALLALEQAYSNKHSPQHRAACLVEARTVLASFARPIALAQRGEPVAPKWWHCDTHGPGNITAWGCPECVREMRQELAQRGEPVAWMRDSGEPSISTMAYCIPESVRQVWLKANPAQVERYTIPLYTSSGGSNGRKNV